MSEAVPMDPAWVPMQDAPAAKKPKPTSVEQIYQKKSQLEHILLRPDTYIGKLLMLEKFPFISMNRLASL